MEKSTKCVHTGTIKDLNGGIVSPISPSTAYNYVDVDTYRYPRYFNVSNSEAVEKKMAALEGAEEGILFSSGMSATMTTLLSFLRSGDHIILQEDIYGGTQDSVRTELNKFNIDVTFCAGKRDSIASNIKGNTKVVFIESPSNPLIGIIDLQAISELAKENNITTIIDSTFATPINQTPHSYGIDVVLHSATKYIGGHSDISAGVITLSSELKNQVRETALHLGGNLDTQACWLLERSLKTLEVRVVRQNQNAEAIAKFLDTHSEVSKVNYPGLNDHPDHDLAKSQMSGFGGMLSFEVSGDPDRFVKSLKLISPAMSLGGVETTITSPSQTSHARISAEERASLGISDQLLRLSVGIEGETDLINDLEQALGTLS